MLSYSLRRLGFTLPLLALLALPLGLRAEESAAAQPVLDAAAAYSIDTLSPALTTPEAAFAFVRDRIAYEPYAGVMKGPAGTLLTRGGNSWDRALLLQKLLAAQGVEAQLAVGTLSQKEATKRFVTVTQRPAAAKLIVDSLPMAEPDSPEDPELQELQADLQQRMTRRMAELEKLETVPREWIDPALVGLEPLPVEAPRELVWVRATIDGQVVALDPSLPTAKLGDVPTVEGDVAEHAEAPEEAFHRVVVRVAVENLSPQGGLRRSDLLERTFTAASLQEMGLRLALLPRTAGKAVGDFRVLLFAGEEKSESEGFRLSGAPAQEGAKGGESAGLGGMFGGEEEPEPVAAPSSEPTATDLRLARLYVEFTFVSPGLPDETFRRTIIDRAEPVGEGWGLVAALADDRTVRPLLVQIWDAALDVGAEHPIAVWEAQWAALEALDPLLLTAEAGAPIEPGDVGVPVASPSLRAFFLASGLRRLALCSAVGPEARSFAVRPRLALLRHGAEIADWTRPGAVAPRYREGVDLVNTPHRFLGTERAGELARQAGVADTALEVHALGEPATLNTLPVFAAAKNQKLKLVAVSNPSELRERNLPPAVQAVLMGELMAGRRTVMTEKPVAYGGSHVFAWWSVDTASGFALGRMELGGGQGFAEVAKMNKQVSDWTEIFAKFYGSVMKCYMTELAKALGGVDVDYATMNVKVTAKQGAPGQSPVPEFGQYTECVVKAACSAIMDLMTSQINVAIANAEAKRLREMIAQLVAGKALKKANKGFCKDLANGGKK